MRREGQNSTPISPLSCASTRFTLSSSRTRTNRLNRYRSFIRCMPRLASSRISSSFNRYILSMPSPSRRENSALTRHTRNVSYVKYRCRIFVSVYTHAFRLRRPITLAKRYLPRPTRMLRLDEIRDNARQLHARAVHCYVTAISQLFSTVLCLRIQNYRRKYLLCQKSLFFISIARVFLAQLHLYI